MQTKLADFIKNSPQGQEADAILRSCVHCGFCLATCPTYQILGDELDSPRGRIYLMKQMLEGQPVTHKTQLHLQLKTPSSSGFFYFCLELRIAGILI